MSAATHSGAPVDDAPPTRYAVIDLAIAESLRAIVPRLDSAVAEPLFDRALSAEVLAVGPWLVALARAPAVARRLAEAGADLPWGYYLDARAEIAPLRLSLRHFNLARVADAPEPMLFRYWDPRILRTFLGVATPRQRARFFDGIARIEAPHGGFAATADGPASLEKEPC